MISKSDHVRLNRAWFFAALALVFSIAPLIGVILALIGFYNLSLVRASGEQKVKTKRNVYFLLLVLASVVCIGVSVYFAKQYIEAQEIQRLLSQ